MAEEAKKNRRGLKALAFVAIFLSIILYGFYLYGEVKIALNPPEPNPHTATQQVYLEEVLNRKYAERTSLALSPLPYALNLPNIDINAESAILIDTATGSILYEKNADEEIPPASLTKIVEMYVIFQAVEAGEVSMDDEVPLPPQSWSENLPSDASRMYLGRGQHVTLRELLLGLSIASGNDASIACAYYICGNMEDFVDRMNKAAAEAGLTHTHFVESSGYSEENITTAREFATFARMYINKYPFALSQFHSKEQLRYPLTRNLSSEERKLGKSPITQPNTNKLLSVIKGCDGLKTGFIDESGYNISVTARNNGTRFLSVTMRGPGANTAEGNKYRVEDNVALFDFAFKNFTDYNPKTAKVSHEFTVGVLGDRQKSARLVPALNEVFTVPFIEGESVAETAENVYVTAEIPDVIFGAVECGNQYGILHYKLGEQILRSVPLVADRDIEESNAFDVISGKIAYKAIEFAKKIKNR